MCEHYKMPRQICREITDLYLVKNPVKGIVKYHDVAYWAVNSYPCTECILKLIGDESVCLGCLLAMANNAGDQILNTSDKNILWKLLTEKPLEMKKK